MNSSRRTTVIVAAAGAIGLAADQLVRAPAWGVNVPLAAALLAGAGAAMSSEDGRSPPAWPWLASVFFASMWAFRDAQPLLAVDLLAALALASLPLLQQAGIRLRAVPLIDLCLAPLRAARTVTFGTLGFLQFAHHERSARVSSSHARAVAVGALLAVPLVLVFGSLFASADPVFDGMVSTVFSDNLGPLLSHSVTAVAFAWATAGYLWFLTRPERDLTFRSTLPALGRLQVLTPLAATVVLFGFFVGVQATSLFGGATYVETSTGLTFAEYARGGFFQLVFASMLVLPLVYFAPAAAGPLDEAATAGLRKLLGTQLALTGLVLASALWRMMLYVRTYGLTVDRVNGTAIMLWIAGTLGVFALTVVRGRPQTAAFGSLVAAVVVLTALNLANPDALIARYNVEHQNGRQIDFQHLTRLGADAVPILAAQMDLVPAGERCNVVTALRSHFLAAEHDWRGWNLARARAREAVTGLDPSASCPATTPAHPPGDP